MHRLACPGVKVGSLAGRCSHDGEPLISDDPCARHDRAAKPFGTGGRRASLHGAAVSSCAATRRSRSSRPSAATSWTPTGSPGEYHRRHGTPIRPPGSPGQNTLATACGRQSVHSHLAYLQGARMGSLMTINHDALPATAAPTSFAGSWASRKDSKLARRPRCRSRSGGGARCSATLSAVQHRSRLASLALLHVHGRARSVCLGESRKRTDADDMRRSRCRGSRRG